MKNVLAVLLSISASFALQAQKIPLVHSVYDGWKSAGERHISNNGKYVFYTINPQEGDGVLFVQGLDNSFRKEIPRGYLAKFTEDNRFVIFKIRPYFKDTRDARIKKKRPDEMPKDSLGIIELGKDTVIKIARVKSFKVPEKGLFESGLMIKNIYRRSLFSFAYIGVGGGVFYRYGYYTLPKAADNWAFKWGFNISF